MNFPLLFTGVVAFVVGVVVLTFLTKITRFFRGFGEGLFGSRTAGRAYTNGNVAIAGVGFMAIGLLWSVLGASGVGT